jgi:hypothetical protein
MVGTKTGNKQAGSKAGKKEAGSKAGKKQGGSKARKKHGGTKAGKKQGGTKAGKKQAGTKTRNKQAETRPGKKQGPVSYLEREQYRAQIANDAEWGRPTESTATKVCELAGVDPATLRAPRSDDKTAAAQAFTVALDLMVARGDRGEAGAQLTWNALFDSLARHWSVTYRDAQHRGARVSYDMTRGTISAAWREMLLAGFDPEAIWNTLIAPTGPLAHLYELTRISGREHARGRKVRSIESALLDDVRLAILDDVQYEHQDRRRLLLADAEARSLPLRQGVCEERPYEIVTLGDRSRRVIGLLESARVRFYVDQFRTDFEVQPNDTLRPVYAETAGLSPERDADGNGYVKIRSRFFLAINRRFHAADFWPEHVASDSRARWFGIEPVMDGQPVRNADGRLMPTDGSRVINDMFSGDFIERDISSSQTQVLAAFLDLEDLAELAGRKKPKFKEYLSERLWAIHERDDILAPGYDDGPTDARLIAFVKEHWMRWNYGGRFNQIVRDLSKNKAEYGPGWRSDVYRTGGVKRAEGYWKAFLASLPEWERFVSRFLFVCHEIGRDANWEDGLVLDDPLDGAEIRWNPIRRATDKVPTGKHYVEVRRPGIMRSRRRNDGRLVRHFVSRERHVDTNRLADRVAPCLVQTLDAYFSALVLERLHKAGIRDVVAIHDSWFVPLVIYYSDGAPTRAGQKVLEDAIAGAGREWLEGIGGVYGWFADALIGTPYRKFARELRQRWRRRVAEKRWPKFTAS